MGDFAVAFCTSHSVDFAVAVARHGGVRDSWHNGEVVQGHGNVWWVSALRRCMTGSTGCTTIAPIEQF